MDINIDDIKITDRIRKDNGDISSFADNLEEIGLLHPIVINEANELICGHRRVLAFKKLQRKQIPCIKVNLASLAKGEFSENAYRKDFTFSEMVEIKRILGPEIKREAQMRMKAGKPSSKLVKGRSTEILAKALRIGHTSLEKAEKLVDAAEKQPEKFKQLLEKVDNGKISLDVAYKQILQLPEAHKDKKQVGEASQARATITDESKRIFPKITNEKQEPKPDNDIRTLQEQNDYFAKKLAEKSPEFPELYQEIKELKQIQRERIRHGDFNSAASLGPKNEQQDEIDRLKERIDQLNNLLAKNRFKANLTIKEKVFPVIILIDSARETAKVMIDDP